MRHDDEDLISMEDNDNAMPVKSRILIQPDWNEGPDSWLMVKTPGQTSLRSVYYDNGNAAAAAAAREDGFSIQKHRSTLLSVTHPRAGYTASFVAPSAVWPNVHGGGGEKRSAVVALDVTEGGLGASATSSGELNVWTTSNGEVRRRLEGHVDAVYTARFFPSGTVILSGGADLRVKIWAAETGQCAATLVGHRGAVNDVAIVERGRNVVSASSDGAVKLWDVGRGSCIHSFDDLGVGVNAISLGVADRRSGGETSVDENQREVGTEGKFLIVAGEGSGAGLPNVGNGDATGGKVCGVVLKSREKFFELPTPSPVNACLALDDRTFAYGLQDGTVAVADVRNLKASLHAEKECRGAVLRLCAFRSGGFLVSTQDGSTFYVPSKAFSSSLAPNAGQTVVELTGPDTDPVYQVAAQGRNVVYTACRDGRIRKYLIDEELMAGVES